MMFQSVEHSDDAYMTMNKQECTRTDEDVIFTQVEQKESHLNLFVYLSVLTQTVLNSGGYHLKVIFEETR